MSTNKLTPIYQDFQTRLPRAKRAPRSLPFTNLETETPVFLQFPALGELRVRRIISRSAPRPVTKYPSVRLGRTVHCESSLEVDVAELLDACGQVTGFGEQPVIIRYVLGGVRHWHVPDFMATTLWNRVLIEVKFTKDVTPEVLERTQFLTHALRSLGYDYCLVTEEQIHRGAYLDNARYLLRRGRTRIPTRRGLELFSQIKAAGNLPFGVFDSDEDRTIVARLILDGRLSVPMDTALGPYSPVGLASREEGQPWAWALFN